MRPERRGLYRRNSTPSDFTTTSMVRIKRDGRKMLGISGRDCFEKKGFYTSKF